MKTKIEKKELKNAISEWKARNKNRIILRNTQLSGLRVQWNVSMYENLNTR